MLWNILLRGGFNGCLIYFFLLIVVGGIIGYIYQFFAGLF